MPFREIKCVWRRVLPGPAGGAPTDPLAAITDSEYDLLNSHKDLHWYCSICKSKVIKSIQLDISCSAWFYERPFYLYQSIRICYNDWTLYLRDKHQVVIVYIDFRKTFDVVSHKKLFTVLHYYGICGNLFTWLCNLFTGRTHCTKVGTKLSDFLALISGVGRLVWRWMNSMTCVWLPVSMPSTVETEHCSLTISCLLFHIVVNILH